MALFDCTKINLRSGSKGENVKKLQEALKTLGYYTRSVDSDFGYYTGQAVQNFQRAYKLTVDGWFGSETCKKLNEVMESKNTSTSSTGSTVISLDCPRINLSYGSSGENVKKLQTMLKELGYYSDTVSGNFKTNTKNAVINFQKATGHTPDGVFGPKTCPDLNTAYMAKVGKTAGASAGTGTSTVKDSTPTYRQRPRVVLTVLPDVVVLPESEQLSGETETGQTSKTGGSINTDTNFDCSKINLKKGSKGEDVKKLQTILKSRGYYTRQIDGNYGNYTVKAVKKLQAAQGNSQDGWFGPKTCNKLQGTSATSNTATGTQDKKNTKFVIDDFQYVPNISADLEGFSHEVTLTTPYSFNKYSHIRKLQKTETVLYRGTNVIKTHEGYINEIKVSQNDNMLLLEITIAGYNVFLEQSVEMDEKTAKRSALLKELIELAGLKANINTSGLTDDEYTLKVAKAEATSSSGGGGGLTQLSGNDCTGQMQTNQLSARSFDINTCGGNTKIGNSSANYATETAGMSAKEAIMDIYNRFKYGPSLTSSAVYNDNRRCPRTMWTKTGKIFGNCADISRLIKCVGEVHGLKVGIRHCPSHYYNLIEVNGTTYRFDCCFKSGTTGARYGSENCNNLSMRGGPWSN